MGVDEVDHRLPATARLGDDAPCHLAPLGFDKRKAEQLRGGELAVRRETQGQLLFGNDLEVG